MCTFVKKVVSFPPFFLPIHRGFNDHISFFLWSNLFLVHLILSYLLRNSKKFVEFTY